MCVRSFKLSLLVSVVGAFVLGLNYYILQPQASSEASNGSAPICMLSVEPCEVSGVTAFLDLDVIDGQEPFMLMVDWVDANTALLFLQLELSDGELKLYKFSRSSTGQYYVLMKLPPATTTNWVGKVTDGRKSIDVQFPGLR